MNLNLHIFFFMWYILSAGVNAENKDKYRKPAKEWKYRDEEKKLEPDSDEKDQEAIIEQLLRSITTNEKYHSKIINVEDTLRRFESAMKEKTSIILKAIKDVQKSKGKFSNEVELLIELQEEVKRMVTMMKNPIYYKGATNTNMISLDNRISFIEKGVQNLMGNVETIMNSMDEVTKKAKSRTHSSTSATDNSMTDTLSLVTEFKKSIQDYRNKKCDCSSYRSTERYPTDCHEIQVLGFNVSGIYKIKPDEMEPFYVLCDLNTAGGGWTVFQNRFDGTQDFYKPWWDYKQGFGNLAGEFWLGLDKLHTLTNQKLYELRVDMESIRGQEVHAGFTVFTVGPEHEGYRISTLGNYHGNAGDSLSYHAGQKFSTPDVDNDEWSDGACAVEHGGGWWYKECDKSNLNGKYLQKIDDRNKIKSIYWVSFKGLEYTLTKTKMMIRPLPTSKPSSRL